MVRVVLMCRVKSWEETRRDSCADSAQWARRRRTRRRDRSHGCSALTAGHGAAATWPVSSAGATADFAAAQLGRRRQRVAAARPCELQLVAGVSRGRPRRRVASGGEASCGRSLGRMDT